MLIENQIQEIKKYGKCMISDDSRELYMIDGSYVMFFKKDNCYLDLIKYKRKDEYLWNLNSISDYMHEFSGPIEYIEHDVRYYGEPKLKKPAELKNSICLGSVGYGSKKVACKMYLLDGHIWIKQRDYFSSSKITGGVANNDIRSKFVYKDEYGSTVYRNEAWIRINNLYTKIINSKSNNMSFLIYDILSKQEECIGLEKNELIGTSIEKFWEEVVYELKKIYKKNN